MKKQNFITPVPKDLTKPTPVKWESMNELLLTPEEVVLAVSRIHDDPIFDKILPPEPRRYLAVAQAQLAKVLNRDRPKIICLCGSTRFKRAFHQSYAKLSDEGNIVLTVSRLNPQHKAVNEAQDIIRHELHMRKIDLADELLVLNVDGYIGESLSKEIAYAKKLGKPIKYLEEVNNG